MGLHLHHAAYGASNSSAAAAAAAAAASATPISKETAAVMVAAFSNGTNRKARRLNKQPAAIQEAAQAELAARLAKEEEDRKEKAAKSKAKKKKGTSPQAEAKKIQGMLNRLAGTRGDADLQKSMGETQLKIAKFQEILNKHKYSLPEKEMENFYLNWTTAMSTTNPGPRLTAINQTASSWGAMMKKAGLVDSTDSKAKK